MPKQTHIQCFSSLEVTSHHLIKYYNQFCCFCYLAKLSIVTKLITNYNLNTKNIFDRLFICA